jgi:uncharacterized membrane protein YeiB
LLAEVATRRAPMAGVVSLKLELERMPAGLVTVAPVARTEVRPAQRVLGYDLARSLAILFMLLDHCGQVFGIGHTRAWQAAYQMTDGRASAIFVLLAGVGVSLLRRKHSPEELQRTLLRRGAFLLILGLVNQIIWPGDILRVFGVALMLAGFLSRFSSTWLVLISAAIMLAFPALKFCFDYYAHWDANMIHYFRLWTPGGMVRNLFFDGYRPVIPWAALLVLGMCIGRLDVTRAQVRRMIVAGGVALLLLSEVASRLLLIFLPRLFSGLSDATLHEWLEFGSIPPLPPFVISVTGSALLVTGVSLMIGARSSKPPLMTALVSTGQMALTWYVAHVTLLALYVHFFGRSSDGSGTRAVLLGVSAFGIIVACTLWWKRRWTHGPMEWLLRSVG